MLNDIMLAWACLHLFPVIAWLSKFIDRKRRLEMPKIAMIIASAILMAYFASAQVPTAELTETVTGPTAASGAGAEVVITATASNVRRVLTTNPAGVYIAPAIQPGLYSMRVSAK